MHAYQGRSGSDRAKGTWQIHLVHQMQYLYNWRYEYYSSESCISGFKPRAGWELVI